MSDMAVEKQKAENQERMQAMQMAHDNRMMAMEERMMALQAQFKEREMAMKLEGQMASQAIKAAQPAPGSDNA